jgi:hypothetical protein
MWPPTDPEICKVLILNKFWLTFKAATLAARKQKVLFLETKQNRQLAHCILA